MLIDRQMDETTWQGRTYADAPDIDGTVLVSGSDIEVGQFVPVEITARDGYDLVGVHEAE